MHNRVTLKKILKFTLKQLLHVSVQSPSSVSVIFEFAKAQIITSPMMAIVPKHVGAVLM